jgi:hypothetical protein
VHLELIKESEWRAEQALVNVFRGIGVQDSDTATSHEGVSTVSLTTLDSAEQTFLLRTNQLAGGLNDRPNAGFPNHQKLHWNYLLLTGISGFEILIQTRTNNTRARGNEARAASLLGIFSMRAFGFSGGGRPTISAYYLRAVSATEGAL